MSIPVAGNLDAFLTPEVKLGATVILVWLVCAGLSGWIAGRRNRDDGLWTVFGLFAGPVALAAILLLPRSTKERPLTPLWAELEKKERQEQERARREQADPGTDPTKA